MKYTFIASLVPKGENFDESAIVNEGGYLTTTHMDAVEKKGKEMEAAIAAHPAALQKVTEQVTEANAAKETAEKALTTANTTIESNKTKITELEATISKLNKQPATDPKLTSTTKDPAVVEEAKDEDLTEFLTSYDKERDLYKQ